MCHNNIRSRYSSGLNMENHFHNLRHWNNSNNTGRVKKSKNLINSRYLRIFKVRVQRSSFKINIPWQHQVFKRIIWYWCVMMVKWISTANFSSKITSLNNFKPPISEMFFISYIIIRVFQLAYGNNKNHVISALTH